MVQVALDRVMAGRTVLVIAHRLATVRRAHTVLVMVGGRIVEHGTHDSLMTKPNGVYTKLVQRQMASNALLEAGSSSPDVKTPESVSPRAGAGASAGAGAAVPVVVQAAAGSSPAAPFASL
jgi:ABC-type dipeptide/oligopeptide/nickel transport system ATPase component